MCHFFPDWISLFARAKFHGYTNTEVCSSSDRNANSCVRACMSCTHVHLCVMLLCVHLSCVYECRIILCVLICACLCLCVFGCTFLYMFLYGCICESHYVCVISPLWAHWIGWTLNLQMTDFQEDSFSTNHRLVTALNLQLHKLLFMCTLCLCIYLFVCVCVYKRVLYVYIMYVFTAYACVHCVLFICTCVRCKYGCGRYILRLESYCSLRKARMWRWLCRSMF